MNSGSHISVTQPTLAAQGDATCALLFLCAVTAVLVAGACSRHAAVQTPPSPAAAPPSAAGATPTNCSKARCGSRRPPSTPRSRPRPIVTASSRSTMPWRTRPGQRPPSRTARSRRCRRLSSSISTRRSSTTHACRRSSSIARSIHESGGKPGWIAGGGAGGGREGIPRLRRGARRRDLLRPPPPWPGAGRT